MANGPQPAAGGHWIADAPPNFRARVVERMMKNLPQQLLQKNDPQGTVSRFEDKVFRQSVSLEAYLRTISMKMMLVQQKCQPVVQPASDHQQQAHMGHQMRPVNAVLQVQSHPRHPVVTHIQTQCPATRNSTEQPQPQLARVNHQDSRVNQHQGYYSQGGGTMSNVATMQIAHPEVQNSQQLGHPAGEVDWREDAFQKITALKDAHLSELVEIQRALRALVPHDKTNQQLEALPREQADQYRKTVHIMERVRHVLRFLHIQKSNIPELSRDEFHKCQTYLYALLKFYRQRKAQSVGRQSSQNCHELPGANGATDNNSQQNHEVQPAAEAFPESRQNVPATSPLAQQQDHSDHLAGEAENVEVCPEAEAPPVAVDPTAVTGYTAPFPDGTSNLEIRREHPTDEAIPQLTHDVDPAQTPPAQQQTGNPVHVEGGDESVPAKAETPVAVKAARTSSPPAALRSLASDMGVNMKRAFRHTTMEPSGESCYKRPRTHVGSLSLPDEIRAVQSMLVMTEISISEGDTGGADGKVIKLCYNAVSLTPGVREAVGASEISTKLLVPADYPRSSPVVLGGDGEQRMGVPAVVDVSFRRALVLLPEPRSIEEMAREWDCVVRRAVGLFASRLGGGMFSTRYGCFESCIPA
ncbi:unnamed protein product [Alopecurus aequalis]